MNSLDYFGQSVRASPLLHMWSLAVEEQFYLVWPLLMLVCLQFVRSRRVLQTVLVALTACSFACGIWQSYHAPAFAFYLLPARGWEFGLGALLNFIPSQPLPKTYYLSWAGLFAVVLAFCLIRADMPFPGWVALLPTLGTAMLIMWRADQPPSLIRAFLNSGPIQLLGDLSYSWYLWHWPFLVLAAALWPTISVFGRVLAAVLSLGVAWLTYRILENPIRFNPKLAARPYLTYAVSAALMFACIGAAAASRLYAVHLSDDPKLARIAKASEDIADMERSRCVSLGTDGEVKTSDTGDPESRIQIDLAGDSHAIQWFNPLKQIASEKHWHLRTYLKSGCPITDIPLRGDSIDYARGCVAWRRAAIQQIVKDQPSLIVIGNATNYLFSKSTDQAPTMTFAEWQGGFSSTLQSLRPSGATILLLRDSPTPPFDVPSWLGRAAKTTWFRVNCAFPARPALHEAAFASERDSASNLSNVKLLDLSSYFCDRDHCWPDRNGVVVYRDDDHITGTCAGELADPLANILQSAIQHANSGNTINLRAQAGVLSRAPS